ncbi:MAG: SpoIIE family protein phosphatase, partial [Chloroflexia bacterium]
LRGGRVSATLDILSVDLKTRTVVLSRNDESPAYLFTATGVEVHDEPACCIGIYPRTKPVVIERPIDAYLGVLVTSDGVVHAGRRHGRQFDLLAFLHDELAQQWPAAQELADRVLDAAIALEQGRPTDDVSVIALTIVPTEESEAPVRRLHAHFPIE